MLAGVQVEHELRERAVQARDRALHHREARPGDPPGGLEVEPAVELADRDVVARLEGERARHADAAHLDVGALVGAVRHRLVQQVRQPEREPLDLGLHGGELGLGGGLLLAERLDLLEERRDVGALGLRLTDRLGAGVALVAQRVGTDLDGLAAVLERVERGDVEGEAAPREVRGDAGGFGAQQFRVEHDVLGAGGPVAWRQEPPPRRRASASLILISRPRGTGS